MSHHITTLGAKVSHHITAVHIKHHTIIWNQNTLDTSHPIPSYPITLHHQVDGTTLLEKFITNLQKERAEVAFNIFIMIIIIIIIIIIRWPSTSSPMAARPLKWTSLLGKDGSSGGWLDWIGICYARKVKRELNLCCEVASRDICNKIMNEGSDVRMSFKHL